MSAAATTHAVVGRDSLLDVRLAGVAADSLEGHSFWAGHPSDCCWLEQPTGCQVGDGGGELAEGGSIAPGCVQQVLERAGCLVLVFAGGWSGRECKMWLQEPQGVVSGVGWVILCP